MNLRHTVQQLVSEAFWVTVDDLREPYNIQHSKERYVYYYLVRINMEGGRDDIAAYLNISHETLRKALISVEDRRDIPGFDAKLQELEDKLCTLVTSPA